MQLQTAVFTREEARCCGQLCIGQRKREEICGANMNTKQDSENNILKEKMEKKIPKTFMNATLNLHEKNPLCSLTDKKNKVRPSGQHPNSIHKPNDIFHRKRSFCMTVCPQVTGTVITIHPSIF